MHIKLFLSLSLFLSPCASLLYLSHRMYKSMYRISGSTSVGSELVGILVGLLFYSNAHINVPRFIYGSTKTESK